MVIVLLYKIKRFCAIYSPLLLKKAALQIRQLSLLILRKFYLLIITFEVVSIPKPFTFTR